MITAVACVNCALFLRDGSFVSFAKPDWVHIHNIADNTIRYLSFDREKIQQFPGCEPILQFRRWHGTLISYDNGKISFKPLKALSSWLMREAHNLCLKDNEANHYFIYSFRLGYPINPALSLHRHLKYPLSNFHCTALTSAPFAPNFGVDRFLLPSTASFPPFQSSHHRTDCLVDPTNPKITSIPPPSGTTVTNTSLGQQTKRKRSWSRAVFSQLQRKGLEIQFQIQKYITKPDRRKLAARLGLTDAQVKAINQLVKYIQKLNRTFFSLQRWRFGSKIDEWNGDTPSWKRNWTKVKHRKRRSRTKMRLRINVTAA